jgi:outer membrane protein assembly factor BamB
MRRCIGFSKVLWNYRMCGEGQLCRPKPNSGLGQHICLTPGFSDRLLAAIAARVPLTALVLAAAAFTLALFPAAASAQDVEALVREAGVESGLAVHVPATDGQLEVSLARGERRLVHGLALDAASAAAAQKAILEAGLYGVASVEHWTPRPRLPYADNLVNLLVADAAALGRLGFDEAEAMRVVAPGGAAIFLAAGKGRIIRKPRPPDIDDWTHFDYDVTNNPVSRDARVGPVATVKWIDGYRTLRYHKSASGAVRSCGGVLVHELKTVAADKDRTRDALYLVARDAFNGLVRWTKPVRSTSASGLQSLVAIDGRAYTMAGPDSPLGPLRAYDLADGREVMRYASGGLVETPEQAGGSGHAYSAGAPRWVRVLVHQGTVYQAADDTLYALDAATGARRWAWTDPDGRRLLFATLAPDLGLVFAAATERVRENMDNTWGQWNSRWPASRLAAIVALDAATGRPAWRCDEVAGKTAGQLVYRDGTLAFFSPSGIGAMGGQREGGLDWTWVGALDARTGRVLWTRNYRRDPPVEKGDVLAFAFTLALRGGHALVISQNHLAAFDLADGRTAAHLAPPIPNARCTRPRSTNQYHLMGFGTYVAADLETTVNQNVTRSDCMTGPTPANGMTYHTPNGCTCFAMLRGFGGYASDEPWPPLADDARLDGPEAAPPPAILAQVRPAPPPATFQTRMAWGREPVTLRLPALDGSPVRGAWISNDVLPYPETPPVMAGDLALVAVVNEHRLEARRDGRVAWARVFGGRITTPPVVDGGRAFVACHDGTVTCLEAATGRRLWRFLAAPADRRMAAYGQLESAWPVPGVVMFEGRVCASAGRHPELDGGIYLYGLDASDGRPAWHGRLHREAEAVRGPSPEDKPRKWRAPANTIINAPLVVREGRLVLISPDATNEGVARPTEHYEVVIDPANPPQ